MIADKFGVTADFANAAGIVAMMQMCGKRVRHGLFAVCCVHGVVSDAFGPIQVWPGRASVILRTAMQRYEVFINFAHVFLVSDCANSSRKWLLPFWQIVRFRYLSAISASIFSFTKGSVPVILARKECEMSVRDFLLLSLRESRERTPW